MKQSTVDAFVEVAGFAGIEMSDCGPYRSHFAQSLRMTESTAAFYVNNPDDLPRLVLLVGKYYGGWGKADTFDEIYQDVVNFRIDQMGKAGIVVY